MYSYTNFQLSSVRMFTSVFRIINQTLEVLTSKTSFVSVRILHGGISEINKAMLGGSRTTSLIHSRQLGAETQGGDMQVSIYR